jgi:hypothetical protein
MQGNINFGGKTSTKFLKDSFIPQMFEDFQKQVEISNDYPNVNPSKEPHLKKLKEFFEK